MTGARQDDTGTQRMTTERVKHIARTVQYGLLAGMIVTHTAFAQETTASDEDLGLSAGELVPYEEQFDDWFVICNLPAGGVRECTITQPVPNPLGTLAVRINIWPITDSNLFAAAAAIVTPLGTNLETGIELAVDSNSPRRYGFKYCVPDGCLARIGLLRTELNSMKAGSVWKMVLFELDDASTPIQFDLSLSGFTAAFERLDEIQSEGLDPAELEESPAEN